MKNRFTVNYLGLLLVAIIFVFASGCDGSDSGDDMLGMWVDKTSPKSTLLIERNGANFMIRQTQPNRYADGALKTVGIPSVLKNGVLQTDQFFSLTIDRNSGYLTDGHHEYIRVK